MSMIDRAQEVANKLEGTCDALHQHATDDEQNNTEFCAELDRLVFCCEVCGWWFEQCMMATDTDEWICESCAEE